jgi:MFS family permease
VTAAPGAGVVKRVSGLDFFSRTFDSLANPQYRILWTGMLLMMGAMNMQMLARGQLAWDLTDDALMVTIVGAGFAPPILIFSLFGGAVADRIDRKRIIQAGQFGMAALSTVIAFSIVTETVTIYHLMAASVVQGVLFAFMMPARQAIIPQLVERHQLSNAVALNASGMSLMTVAAPAIGGFIYAWGGAQAAYFTIAGMNFGAFLMTTALKPAAEAMAGPGKRMWKDVKEGLVYVRHNRTVLMLLLLALSTSLLAMPVRQLFPVQIDEVFHKDVDSFGLLLSMIGVGALVGSLTIAGLKQSQHRGLVLLATTAVSGVAILLAGLNTSYFIALFIMVLIGIGDSGRRSLNQSLIMENADAERRGRVMGVYMLNFGMMPLGALPLGAVSEVWGVEWAFAGAGIILIATTVLMTVLTRRIRVL